MGVADKIPEVIIHHDALVEGVKFEEAILPSLLLATEIMCEQAAKFVDRRGILRLRDAEARRAASDGCRHCYDMWSWRRREVRGGTKVGRRQVWETSRVAFLERLTNRVIP
jgi:hypothetical protein